MWKGRGTVIVMPGALPSSPAGDDQMRADLEETREMLAELLQLCRRHLQPGYGGLVDDVHRLKAAQTSTHKEK